MDNLQFKKDYFKTWTNNMAYIFGLWCAIGFAYGGKFIDISLRNKDKYILKQIAKELNYTNSLSDAVDKQISRINLSCIAMYNDLVYLSDSNPKIMQIIKFPKVPDEYLSDFIRGYFDGNGSITKVKGCRINSTFTGNKEFLIDLLSKLKREAGVEGGSYDSSAQSIHFGTKDTMRLGQYMYRNDPELFLLRKRMKFY